MGKIILDLPRIKQFASYIQTQDIISYCHAFPNELEKTVKEDYQKGLIDKQELDIVLEKVNAIQKERKINKYG